MVDAIAAGAQIKPPKVYIIETGEMNAFASGSGGSNSMVAVTRGLLNGLNREELEGVIAHEVAHLKNEDIKFVSLAAALAATLLMILHFFGRGMYFSGRGRRSNSNRSRGGGGNAVIALVVMVASIIAIVLGPLIVRAMQSAVSKQREFLADASGAAIIGYPLGLASALEKIDKHNRRYLSQHATAFSNQSVHALCISRPFTKKVSRLFSTHPPVEERIERLRACDEVIVPVGCFIGDHLIWHSVNYIDKSRRFLYYLLRWVPRNPGCVPVAQLDRASDSDSEVAGSTPVGYTIKMNPQSVEITCLEGF